MHKAFRFAKKPSSGKRKTKIKKIFVEKASLFYDAKLCDMIIKILSGKNK